MDKKEVVIYFGSQTGTALDFAKLLSEEITAKGLKSTVVDLKKFNAKELESQRIVVFIVSTYGKGGPTDNAKMFYAWLTGESASQGDLLKNMNFTVFGLGDTCYSFFNRMGKVTTEKILARGAKQFYKSGYGDASEDIEADFEKWKEGFWAALEPLLKFEESKIAVAPASSLFTLQEAQEPMQDKVEYDLITRQYLESKEIPVLRVAELRQCTEETSTLLLELDSSDIKYVTAETLAIFPSNRNDLLYYFIGKERV